MSITIFLVGPRAVGKTTIGKRLAGSLGLQFVDTDTCLKESEKLSVADIVTKEGWEGFRKRESAVLRKVTAESCPEGPGKVVATGGGMVLAEQNRVYMRKSGMVFFLLAPAEVLAARLEANPDLKQRPSLTGKSVTEEVAQILAERESLYRDAAHHVIDTRANIEETVRAILKILENKFGKINYPE